MEKTLKSKIEFILQEHPETRNSDTLLMIKIIEWYYAGHIHCEGTINYIDLNDLQILPREDHIKRVRAKFNSVGKYLPTRWEVAKARKISEVVWKEAMRVNQY